MADVKLNRFELARYTMLRAQVVQIDEDIREIEDELAELEQYNVKIGPVYTGMPVGNEKIDKIAEFIIQLDKDRNRLNTRLSVLLIERNYNMGEMYAIRAAVNKIQNVQLREIIKSHFFEGQSVSDIAQKLFITKSAVRKRLHRYFNLARNG